MKPAKEVSFNAVLKANCGVRISAGDVVRGVTRATVLDTNRVSSSSGRK